MNESKVGGRLGKKEHQVGCTKRPHYYKDATLLMRKELWSEALRIQLQPLGLVAYLAC